MLDENVNKNVAKNVVKILVFALKNIQNYFTILE